MTPDTHRNVKPPLIFNPKPTTHVCAHCKFPFQTISRMALYCEAKACQEARRVRRNKRVAQQHKARRARRRG